VSHFRAGAGRYAISVSELDEDGLKFRPRKYCFTPTRFALPCAARTSSMSAECAFDAVGSDSSRCACRGPRLAAVLMTGTTTRAGITFLFVSDSTSVMTSGRSGGRLARMRLVQQKRDSDFGSAMISNGASPHDGGRGPRAGWRQFTFGGARILRQRGWSACSGRAVRSRPTSSRIYAL